MSVINYFVVYQSIISYIIINDTCIISGRIVLCSENFLYGKCSSEIYISGKIPYRIMLRKMDKDIYLFQVTFYRHT